MRRTVLLLLFSLLARTSAAAEKAFRPGEVRPDNNGVPINCHGGGRFTRALPHTPREASARLEVNNDAEVVRVPGLRGFAE